MGETTDASVFQCLSRMASSGPLTWLQRRRIRQATTTQVCRLQRRCLETFRCSRASSVHVLAWHKWLGPMCRESQVLKFKDLWNDLYSVAMGFQKLPGASRCIAEAFWY